MAKMGKIRRRPFAPSLPLAAAAVAVSSLRCSRGVASFPYPPACGGRVRLVSPSASACSPASATVVVLRAAVEIGDASGLGAVFLDRAADGDRENAGGRASAPYMEHQPQPPRTLYDVLDCSPAATREELKASYVALARLSHPDAVLQRRRSSPGLPLNLEDENSDDDDNLLPDFNEVARAYRKLSDRKSRLRYDRRLQAERLSSDVEAAASGAAGAFGAAFRVARGAANAVGGGAQFVGSGAQFVAKTAARAAQPLGRRVTAGASAAAAVAGRELSSALREERDRTYAAGLLGVDGGIGAVGLSAGEHIGSAFMSAVAASAYAAKNVDALEILEEAEELERAAEEIAALSRAVDHEVSDMARFRTRLTLSTATADLSSTQAQAILADLSSPTAGDELGSLERLFKVRKPIGEEIALLEEAERAHYDVCAAHYDAQQELDDHQFALRDAEMGMDHARQAESRAASTVDEAGDLVGSNAAAVGRREGRFGAASKAVEKAAADLTRASARLAERRERVRVGLHGKGEEIGYGMDGGEHETDVLVSGANAFTALPTPPSSLAVGIDSPTTSGGESTFRIEELSQRERALAAELADIEGRAARLRSRAAKLAARAEMMESVEEEGSLL